jgi:type I restriction enzyme S subunit
VSTIPVSSEGSQTGTGATNDSRAWTAKTIEELVEPGRAIAYGVLKPGPHVQNGVRLLKSNQIRDGVIDLSDDYRISTALAEEFRRTRLRGGELLLNVVGSIGRSAVAGSELEGANVSRAIAVLPLDKTRVRWVQLFLSSPQGQADMLGRKVGIAQPVLNLGQVKKLLVPLPPLEEQHRIIAEIEKQFTRLEAGVAGLRRVQANLKRYRAAVLKAAFEGKLVPTEAELARQEGRNYETGAQLLERILSERRQKRNGKGKYKEPEKPDAQGLPLLPKGWVWASLDELQKLLRNGISTKPDADVGLPILRISAVRPMSVDLSDTRFLKASANDYSEFILSAGDLLFTRYNGNPALVGVCGVVPAISSEVVHPDKLIRCTLVSKELIPQFVAIMANVGASREFLAKRVRTTAGQAGISGGDLKSLPVPLAPLAEQQRIVAEVERRLSVVEEIEAVVNDNLQRAPRLHQSILLSAFNGKLVGNWK